MPLGSRTREYWSTEGAALPPDYVGSAALYCLPRLARSSFICDFRPSQKGASIRGTVPPAARSLCMIHAHTAAGCADPKRPA